MAVDINPDTNKPALLIKGELSFTVLCTYSKRYFNMKLIHSSDLYLISLSKLSSFSIPVKLIMLEVF